MRESRPILHRRARPVLGHPVYPVERRRPAWGMRLLVLLGALLLAAALGGAGAFWWAVQRPPSSDASIVRVHVQAGEGVTELADQLHGMGLISNPLLFRIDARLHNLAGTLKVGYYPLRRNMSVDQIVSALAVYHPQTIQVTIPEGLRMEQIAALLQKHGINGTRFLQVARTAAVSSPILATKPKSATLEGYLFPNTYEVAPHYDARLFAQMMVRTLNSEFTPAMRAQAAREHLTVNQVLTLASIVEREAKASSERPLIASVYLNRLDMHPPMPLQADPTVQYALGTDRKWWPDLTIEALHSTDSPYNTYEHLGLPPGPICNPGLASIKAVVRPAKTDYLYFVAKGNGHHAFAATYQQQLANEAKYQHP